MILKINNAKYVSNYRIQLTFNSGETGIVDLEKFLFTKNWEIVKPLRDLKYFKKFRKIGSTIGWNNDFDLAPEFLYKISDFKRKEQLIFTKHRQAKAFDKRKHTSFS